MQGTKLRQSAGSPLISGSSRYVRPFFHEWLRGWAVALVLGYATMVAVMAFNDSGLETALRTVWMPALPASALGALIGVWIARRMGWRRSWLAGGILGALLVGASTVAFVIYLVSRLSG